MTATPNPDRKEGAREGALSPRDDEDVAEPAPMFEVVGLLWVDVTTGEWR